MEDNLTITYAERDQEGEHFWTARIRGVYKDKPFAFTAYGDDKKAAEKRAGEMITYWKNFHDGIPQPDANIGIYSRREDGSKNLT